MFKKICLSFFCCFLYENCFAQNSKNLIIIDEIFTEQYDLNYVTTPVFALKKIKLNKKIIEQLGFTIKEFKKVSTAYMDAELSRVLDTVEHSERTMILKSKYRLFEAERALKKIFFKILPKTQYCGYNIQNGNGINLLFFDNTAITISFNSLNIKAPLTIKFIKDDVPHFTSGIDSYVGVTTEINYYLNGNIKSIFSTKNSDYPLNEYYGFYGLYNQNGTIIKETRMEKEHKYYSRMCVPGENATYQVLERYLSRYLCGDRNIEPIKPVIRIMHDTNYGCIWIVNYLRIKRRDEKKTYTEGFDEQMKTIENCIKIIKNDNGEILVEEILNDCFTGNIPLEGKKYSILKPNYFNFEDNRGKDIIQMEKEQNKIIIALKKLPFSPENF